jgi:hypothetical protein
MNRKEFEKELLSLEMAAKLLNYNTLKQETETENGKKVEVIFVKKGSNITIDTYFDFNENVINMICYPIRYFNTYKGYLDKIWAIKKFL